MAVVAAAARRSGRVVGELLADAALRDALTLAPIAHHLAGARITQGSLLRFLYFLSRILRRFPLVLAAEGLHFILVQAVDRRLAARLERGLQHLGCRALRLGIGRPGRASCDPDTAKR